MINPLSLIPASKAGSASLEAPRAEARQEFLTIFYKELLKQAFKAPDLSLGESEQENAFVSAFNSDLMVEQLARELVKNGSFDPGLVSQQLLGSQQALGLLYRGGR